ncbi:hypothetical protein [Spirosoma aerophilum]
MGVCYYAFVLWKYYREDIRERISNRGEKSKPAASEVNDDDEEEELEDTGLYAVRTYSDPNIESYLAESDQVASPTKSTPYQTPAEVTKTTPEQVYQEVDIPEGVIVHDEEESVFGLALPVETIRPAERSLADVINAAQRVTPDEQGSIAPNDPSDVEAAEVATIINAQRGKSSLLDGVKFNR